MRGEKSLCESEISILLLVPYQHYIACDVKTKDLLRSNFNYAVIKFMHLENVFNFKLIS